MHHVCCPFNNRNPKPEAKSQQTDKNYEIKQVLNGKRIKGTDVKAECGWIGESKSHRGIAQEAHDDCA